MDEEEKGTGAAPHKKEMEEAEGREQADKAEKEKYPLRFTVYVTVYVTPHPLRLCMHVINSPWNIPGKTDLP